MEWIKVEMLSLNSSAKKKGLNVNMHLTDMWSISLNENKQFLI
jgi:hypothetical protein